MRRWLYFPAPAAAGPSFPVDAADFDGTNDYMSRGAGLTGAADGSKGIFSFWFRMDGGDGISNRIMEARNGLGDLCIQFSRTAANKLNFFLRNADTTASLDVTSGTGSLTAGTGWHHAIISWDTNFTAGNKLVKLVIDGATDTPTITDGDAAFNTDYTTSDIFICANTGGSPLFNGCLAEFYFNIATYLDVTQAANLAKWRTAGGKPVDLGADGSTPTGTAPIVFQRVADGGAASSFATNLGTGGNMTITGTLDSCSTTPSD